MHEIIGRSALGVVNLAMSAIENSNPELKRFLLGDQPITTEKAPDMEWGTDPMEFPGLITSCRDIASGLLQRGRTLLKGEKK